MLNAGSLRGIIGARGTDQFQATQGQAAVNPNSGVAQPQCGAWIDAILTGNVGVANLQAWFGASKVVHPEAVGPTAVAPRPLGAVVEQGSLRTAASTIDGVPRTGWVALAGRYYNMLRALNA